MQFLAVNNVKLATVDRGQGVPLLLVHGFPLNQAMWNAQIEVFGQRARVIAPDLCGFGASGVREGTVTMEQFADDLAGLLDGLGVEEPVVFCGLSMGGYIGWQFFARHRERLRALVLCDTRAAADAPEAAANRRGLADRVLREGPAPVADAMLPRLTAEVTPKIRPEVIESLRAMILSCDPRGIAAASRGMAERPDSTGMLGRIDVPTLVLVGEADAISTPEEMAGIAGAIRGARLVKIPSAGHMSPMENPAEFNAPLGAFLADL